VDIAIPRIILISLSHTPIVTLKTVKGLYSSILPHHLSPWKQWKVFILR